MPPQCRPAPVVRGTRLRRCQPSSRTSRGRQTTGSRPMPLAASRLRTRMGPSPAPPPEASRLPLGPWTVGASAILALAPRPLITQRSELFRGSRLRHRFRCVLVQPHASRRRWDSGMCEVGRRRPRQPVAIAPVSVSSPFGVVPLANRRSHLVPSPPTEPGVPISGTGLPDLSRHTVLCTSLGSGRVNHGWRAQLAHVRHARWLRRSNVCFQSFSTSLRMARSFRPACQTLKYW